MDAKTLTEIMTSYKQKITPHQYKNLFDAFPGWDDGQIKKMNVESIIHFKQQEDESSDMDLSGDEDEEFVDASGYFGVQHRQKVDLEPITIEELVTMTAKENKLHMVWKTIKEIDNDNNGYVTNSELQDIFTMYYPELEWKNMKWMFKPF